MFKRNPNIIVRESRSRHSWLVGLFIKLVFPTLLLFIGFWVGRWSTLGFSETLVNQSAEDTLVGSPSVVIQRSDQRADQRNQAAMIHKGSVTTGQPAQSDDFFNKSALPTSSPKNDGSMLSSSSPSQKAPIELQKCRDQLKILVQRNELQTVKTAELTEVKQERNELLKLFQFSAGLVNYEALLGVITSTPTRPLHQPFMVCLYSQTKSPVKVGDLVAAQGVLLGEVIELVDHQCVNVLPTVSDQASFEVRLAQSGVHGVAIGMGERSGEEAVGASIKLKYLERSMPAFVGEQVYLVARHQKSKGEFASVQRLPSLVVGEVLSAEMKENGLFQEASVTLPLRRAGVEWVTIISTP
jgi:hypothetical protein